MDLCSPGENDSVRIIGVQAMLFGQPEVDGWNLPRDSCCGLESRGPSRYLVYLNNQEDHNAPLKKMDLRNQKTR
jgi:hypothetical protein